MRRTSTVASCNVDCRFRMLPVHRRLRAFILLTVLLCQSLAVLGSWSVSQKVGDVEHLIVHCQEAKHHHHLDHALHMDDDGGAVQHLHADSGSSSLALLTSFQASPGEVRSMPPPQMGSVLWLSATLEGLLRPPKHRA